MKTINLLRATLGVVSLGLAAIAHADTTLYSETFDSGIGGYNAFAGDAGVSQTLTNVGGALSFQVTIDAINGGYWYAGIFGYDPVGPATINSYALSDLILTFTASAGPAFAGSIPGGLQVKFFSSDANSIGTAFNITSTPTQYSIALSSMTQSGTGVDFSSDYQLRFLPANNGAWPANAGTAGTNILTIDNISITAVSAIPEPSTYAALAGISILGMTFLVRRRQVHQA